MHFYIYTIYELSTNTKYQKNKKKHTYIIIYYIYTNFTPQYNLFSL